MYSYVCYYFYNTLAVKEILFLTTAIFSVYLLEFVKYRTTMGKY